MAAAACYPSNTFCGYEARHSTQDDRRWTLSAALAQDFPDISDILKTCAQYHLKDVELVLALGVESQGSYPIRVPIPPND